EVEVSNAQGSVLIHSGEQAEADPGQKPVKTAVIMSVNLIQWCLYYPGVLDLKDLKLSSQNQGAVQGSLQAYRQGDLLHALETYPGPKEPATESERVYRAGLYLVVGQVDKAKRLLRQISPAAPGRNVLDTLVAAVTLQPKPNNRTPTTASEWLAESYYRQS